MGVGVSVSECTCVCARVCICVHVRARAHAHILQKMLLVVLEMSKFWHISRLTGINTLFFSQQNKYRYVTFGEYLLPCVLRICVTPFQPQAPSR